MGDETMNTVLRDEMRANPKLRLIRSSPDETVVAVAGADVTLRLRQDDHQDRWSITLRCARAERATTESLIGEDLKPQWQVRGAFDFLEVPGERLPDLLRRIRMHVGGDRPLPDWLERQPPLAAGVIERVPDRDGQVLASLIRRFRVIELRGHVTAILRLVEAAFEPRPLVLRVRREALLGDLKALLEQLPGVVSLPPEHLVLLDANWLPADQLAALARVLEEMALAEGDVLTGTPLIVHHRQAACAGTDILIPRQRVSALVRDEAKVRARLAALSLPATPQAIHLCATFTAGDDAEAGPLVDACLRANASADSDAERGLHETPRGQLQPALRAQDLARIRQWREDSRARLEARLIGHEGIKESILNLLAGWLVAPTGPLVVLFCGPSGTGKNLMAETLADLVAGPFEQPGPHYIGFNAAALVHRTGLWQLTGVQKGLVGSESPGLLATLRQGSVLSLDEIDKAADDQDLQAFLCSTLEAGFRNNSGTWRPFPTCLVVLTANAGRDPRDEAAPRPGGMSQAEEARWRERTIAGYRGAMDRLLLPALRGRIAQEIYFPPPTRDELLRAARAGVTRTSDDLQSAGLPMSLDLELEARRLLRDCEAQSVATGFRAMNNALAKWRGNLLARASDPRFLPLTGDQRV